jgi:hypothetical protein
VNIVFDLQCLRARRRLTKMHMRRREKGERAGSTGFAGEKGDGIRSFVRFEHAQMPWRKCYELAQRERQT